MTRKGGKIHSVKSAELTSMINTNMKVIIFHSKMFVLMSVNVYVSRLTLLHFGLSTLEEVEGI